MHVAVVACLIGVIDMAMRRDSGGEGVFVGGQYTFFGFGLTGAACLVIGLVVRGQLARAGHPLQAIQGTKAAWAGAVAVALALMAAVLAPAMVDEGSKRQLLLEEQTQLIPSNQTALFRFAMAKPAIMHYETKFMQFGNGGGGLYLCTVPASDLPQYYEGDESTAHGCRLQTTWIVQEDLRLAAGSYAYVASCFMDTPCSLTIKVEATTLDEA